jgi:kynurenine formamidase
MPYWPGGVPFTMTRLSDYDAGYRSHKFEIGENTGTHVDAPSHMAEGKRNLPDIPLSELVVPLAVLDVRAKVEKDADYLVSGSDIVDWEAVNGPVPIHSVFVVNTGWHKRFIDPDQYINKDAEDVMHFPGLSEEAAKLLVERDVVGVGIDTLSIDQGSAKQFVAHRVLVTANKYMLENLANLDDLPETGATIIVGVLPVANGTQAQARVLALVPDKEESDEEGEDAP